MHVLLVDDDARLRQVMRRLLASHGKENVTEAADGQEALDLLHDRHADLILTDYHMPRVDGIGLVKALRTTGDTTPVIMLSGEDDAGIIVSAIRAGVSNYIPKPINPAILIEKIQQTLGAACA